MTDTSMMPVHLRRDGFDPVADLIRMCERSAFTRLTLATGTEAWLATRYDAIREVLDDATRFSNQGVGIKVPCRAAAPTSPHRTAE